MAYTRTYSEVIYGSKTVSYPASEHGGTTSVSWSEPITLYVTVQDDVFNSSVTRCNSTVGVLGAAVVAATNAQEQAKIAAAKKISKTMIHGFANYTKNLFSQDMIELEAKVNSLKGQLLTFSKNLSDVKTTMESDYNLLKGRYSKFFDKLDKDLERRVHELSSEAFGVSNHLLNDRILKPQLEGVSKTMTLENDIPSSQTVLQLSGLKRLMIESLNKLNIFLRKKRKISVQLETMLEKDSGNKSSTWYSPVFVFEADDKVEGRMSFEMTTSEHLSSESKKKIETAVNEAFVSGKLKVCNIGSDKKNIEMEFIKLLEKEGDERKRKEMLRLWDNYSRNH